MGVGGMITEFGDVTNSTKAIEEINFITGKADEFLQGTSFWAFKEFNDITTQGFESFYTPGGELEVSKVKALSRTYAQKTAGIPTHMFYDPETLDFFFTFNISTNANGPTDIYLNESLLYVNGYNINIEPENLVTMKTQKNHILLYNNNNSNDGDTVKVTITAK
eukprot:TRINITY_DN4193_c0_g1_i2.p1 TRINITY_DN4193_c0_g1~~TRINITY_DN4193_c0_g1_i2.p1  ORF type:complete len:164 (-),score=52.89 TRINITY_DN4193_c0_g1_i2:138-629(-)